MTLQYNFQIFTNAYAEYITEQKSINILSHSDSTCCIITIIIKATEIKVKNLKRAISPVTSDAHNPKGVKDVRDHDQRYGQTIDG